MDKRKHLIKLLELLRWVWAPAEGFLMVFKAWWFDDSIVDTLLNLINNAVEETDNETAKKTLTGSIAVLEKLKAMELESNKQDEKECEELLWMLENIA